MHTLLFSLVVLLPPPTQAEEANGQIALTDVIAKWRRESSLTEKVEGRFRRVERVVGVERWSNGRFIFERPNRSRIEYGPGPDTKNRVRPDKTYTWTTDGTRFLKVSESKKTYSVLEVPATAMNERPPTMIHFFMPLVLGLEGPEERYSISFSRFAPSPESKRIDLTIRPNFVADAAHWREVRMQLDPSTYLPLALKIVDAAGVTETTYTFEAVSKNFDKSSCFKGGANPFNFDLDGYREMRDDLFFFVLVQDPGIVFDMPKPRPSPPQRRRQPPNVPDVSGVPCKRAISKLQEAGFIVVIKRGGPAPRPADVFRVRKQLPSPGTKCEQGRQVVLIVWEKPS